MADLDNAAPFGDDEDDLMSDLRNALNGETPEAPADDAPAEQAAPAEDPADDRARDEKGRFAAKVAKEVDPADTPAEEAPKAVEEAPKEAPPEQAAEGQEQPLRPPPGWSPTAKAAFNELPAEVRQAVAQREVEINNGFAKLSEFKPLEPYVEMAKRNGTTLDYALQQYTGIENLLKQDFLSGIERLCQNSRIDLKSLADAIYARDGLGAPQQASAGSVNPANQQAPVDPEAIRQSVVAQIRAEQEQQQINQHIQQFAADPANIYFPNVRNQMSALMQAGAAATLKEAYDAACWTNPEIRALLIKQQSTGQAQVAKQAAAATQARQAAKSITGSPTPGASTPRAASPDIEDELRAAFRASKV